MDVDGWRRYCSVRGGREGGRARCTSLAPVDDAGTIRLRGVVSTGVGLCLRLILHTCVWCDGLVCDYGSRTTWSECEMAPLAPKNR